MKKTILLVEDERPLAKALRIKLEAEDFHVILVDNGEEAITEIQRSQIDLILLDLVTPRLDGFGVLNHLQELHSTVPVFVISNLSQRGDIKDAKSAGAEKFFIKSDSSLNEIVDDVTKRLK